VRRPKNLSDENIVQLPPIWIVRIAGTTLDRAPAEESQRAEAANPASAAMHSPTDAGALGRAGGRDGVARAGGLFVKARA